MYDRGLKLHHAAHALELSVMAVSRYVKPFGDADRRIPDEKTIAKIVDWTRGEVTAADFYPPELRGGDPAVLAAARCE
jgi:predicted transcriptional regulator